MTLLNALGYFATATGKDSLGVLLPAIDPAFCTRDGDSWVLRDTRGVDIARVHDRGLRGGPSVELLSPPGE